MFRKYYCLSVLIFGFLLVTISTGFAQSPKLSSGDAAPVFDAQASQSGKEFNYSLQKALDKGSVVVYFYPSAYTGGCDLEAHTFAELKDQFTAAGASIIGVSADDIQRLNIFSADPEYCAGKIPVASDPNGKIAASYGLTISPPKAGAKDVRGQDINHGFIPRTTYVIDSKGKILAVFSSETDHISPDEHAKKSLEVVKAAHA